MKHIFTLFCAVLCMSATMYGASADLSDYLTEESIGETESSSFTITTNDEGTLTFSALGEDTEEKSYSVSFTMAVEDASDDTYTVIMSDFSITGSLSSAFGESLTAKITGITQVKFYVGNTEINSLTQTGNGLGGREWDLSTYIQYLDGLSSNLVSLITVKITCTSGASIAMTVDSKEITCGFTAGEDGISFTADGLENIFDTLEVEGDIEEIMSGEKDITEEALTVYEFSSSVTFSDGSWWTQHPLTQDQLFGAVDPESATTIVFTSEETEFFVCYNGLPADANGDYPWRQYEKVTSCTIDATDICLTEDYYFAICLSKSDNVKYTIYWTVYGTEENPDYDPEDPKYSSIQDIKSDVDAVEVARYNLSGQKLSGAQKGINIVVYSDGSSKKVLVK